MSQTGEAAEQIVNMATNVTVKGVECVSNLAGRGALSLATFLIAALKDEKRVSGKTRMRSFRGKPTRVFVIRQNELKTFTQEAKKYGILYAVILDKRNKDGLCDIVVNAEDAGRVNRIADRFALSTVDVEKIREDIIKARKLAAEQADKQDGAGKQQERPDPASDKAHTIAENELDEMLGAPTRDKSAQPVQVANENPTTPRKERSSPSGPISAPRSNTDRALDAPTRPSVRKEINKIKEQRGMGEKQPERQQQQHSAPKKKKSKQKTKGR